MNTNIKRYAAGALVKNQKVLFGKRSRYREEYPGIWDFIGGHCNPGEAYEDALARELMEEIGVRPLKADIIMTVDESPDFILKLFLVTDWLGEIDNKDILEHESLHWFSIEDAMHLDFLNNNYPIALTHISKQLFNKI